MPVVVAIAIRYIIMAAVQLGLWTLLETYGIPLLNGAIAAIMKVFGVSEEVAKDIMANKVLIAFEEVGIFAATLKTKLPIKVAQLLGFTSKGFVTRKLAVAVEQKIAVAGEKIVAKEITAAVITKSVAEAAIETAKVKKVGFKIAYDLLLKSVGVVFMGFMVVGNWIDFGNWNNGAYQKSMQKFLAWISFDMLVPDQDYRQTKTVSAAVFDKVYNTFKLGGALGIQDPWKEVEVPFTRDNFIDVMDQVGATLLLQKGTASTKDVLSATLPMIIFDPNADVDKALASSGLSGSTSATTNASTSTVKVFTGIVSQGVVGAGLTFEARPDDLIESVEELKTAAANNLAPFLATLAGKIVYEVKIVSSIITANGFKQTGTTQKIQTGTFTNGTPKYRSVTNKFATLILYVLTEKGTRTKIKTIVLGPVDSVRLQVQTNDLQALQDALPSIVTTSDVSEITSIVSTTPVATVTPQGATITTTPKIKLGSTQFYKFYTNGELYLQTLPWAGNVPYEYTELTKEQYIIELQGRANVASDFIKKWDTNVMWNIVPKDKTNWDGSHYSGRVWNQGDVDGFNRDINLIRSETGIYAPDYRDPAFVNFQAYAPTPSAQYFTEFYFNTLPTTEQNRLRSLYPGYSFGLDTAPAVNITATQTATSALANKPGTNATTLFEWYQAQGQTLPTIQARAKTYADLGLGQESYYTGTAEQNTKLLNGLKK